MKISERALSDAGIIRRYWHTTLDDLSPTENQMLAYKTARKFVDQFDEMSRRGQTIVFCGPVGTGKTMIVSAMMQSLKAGRYIRAIDISRAVRSSYSSNDIAEIDVIQSFVKPRLLVIDEVGVQQQTENESILISDIIDRRYGDMKPTVICTNLNERELADTFGARAWDRLSQNCIICPIVGTSMRNNDGTA